jgi:predicted AAA+ superfamily ATPase
MEIKRDIYLNKLISKKHNGLIKVITGIRRCGKSYLLFNLFRDHLANEHIADDHIMEMAFDSYENKKYRDPDLFLPYLKERISDREMYYVLLDEVQMLDDFESVLNSLARMKNVDVYVTGSNARFLSKDIITEFRGRGDEVHMYPLTFAEYMSVYDGDVQSGWRDYVIYGGLPLIFSFTTPDQKSDFLKRLFDETYLSDIIGRNNIRNKAELEELLNILSSAIGSLTNATRLSNTFKSVKNKTISKATIQRYIDYLCDSFLVDRAIRYDIKGKKYIDTPSKYYFTDLGLRNARLNFRQIKETHAMENIIFNELKTRGFNIDVGVVEVYEKTAEKSKSVKVQREVDFVANQGSRRYYIQVAFEMPDKEKEKREKASLRGINDSFKKIIIVGNPIKVKRDEDGFTTMSIWDFLLKENSLEL